MKQDFSKTREKNVHTIMKQIRFDPDVVKSFSVLTGGSLMLSAVRNDINSDLKVIADYIQYVEAKGMKAVYDSRKVYAEERQIDERRAAALRTTIGALKSIDKEFRILDQMITTKGGVNSIGKLLSLYLTDVQTDLQLHRAELAEKYPKAAWAAYWIYDLPIVQWILGKSSGRQCSSSSSIYSSTGSSAGGHSAGGGRSDGGGGARF